MKSARPTALLILLSLALPSPLYPASVRALEHPEFSRLLLPVPPAVDWTLQRDGRSTRLALRGPVPTLELNGVFDRMPRSRIRSVGVSALPDGVTLKLELGCDCELVIERLGETLLAVDVRSPGSPGSPGSSGSPGSALSPADSDRAAPGQQASEPLRETLSMAESPETEPAASAPAEGTPAEASAPPPESGEADGAKSLSMAPSAEPPDKILPEADDPVRMARDALVRQLERAAEAGLLDLAPDAAEGAQALTEARPEPEPLDAPLPDVALLPRLTPAPTGAGRSVLSPGSAKSEPSEMSTAEVAVPPAAAPAKAAELEAAAASLPAHLTAREPVAEPAVPDAAKETCVEEIALDVRLWPQASGDLAGALGQMRRALYTESDELDPDAVRDLARLYITVGFGREAAVLLESAGLTARPEPLHDLSMLVEGRSPGAGAPILAADGCGGRVLMWRAVAGAEPLDRNDPSWPMIRENLMELPPRLRRLVGQELARQALLSDRPGVARELIDLLDRTPGDAPQMETRVRAALAISRGEEEFALTLIAPEIERRASPDPETLLLHARATLAAGTVPDSTVMTMLDTAIPGYDSAAPVGRALRLVRAQLEAAAGRPSAALDMVQQVLTASGGTNRDALETGRQILQDLPAEARSGPLGARLILAHRNLLTDGAESQTLRLAYASALIEGGLPNAALTLLATPRVLQDRKTRLIAAQAHMSLGEDDQVFRLLDGLKGSSAARLRSAVYWRAGDMAAAHGELAALAESDGERNVAALLAGEWDALDVDAVAELYAPLAAYAAEQAQTAALSGEVAGGEDRTASSLPTLIAAQNALAQARRLREAFTVAGPES